MSVGVGGMGAIGVPIVRKLLSQGAGIPGLYVKAVTAKNREKALARLASMGASQVLIICYQQRSL